MILLVTSDLYKQLDLVTGCCVLRQMPMSVMIVKTKEWFSTAQLFSSLTIEMKNINVSLIAGIEVFAHSNVV